MNTELINKVIAAIEAEPHRHDQACWASVNPGCGTAMCFAGWAVHLSPEHEIVWATEGDETSFCEGPEGEEVIYDAAQHLLGLDEKTLGAVTRVGATLYDIKEALREAGWTGPKRG